MRHREATRFILDEARASVDTVPDAHVNDLVTRICNAKTVLIFGRGRSGFVGRSLAVRLTHLGFPAYVVGETVTPPVHEDDLVILLSGSGETFSVVVTAQTAKKLGCDVAVVTSHPASTLAKLADTTIVLPVPQGAKQKELAPLGTLFEDACMVFLDGFVAELMHRLGETEESMRNRHATLE